MTIPFFPAGYGPSPGDMGSWIQGSFAALTVPALFRGEQTVAQALTAGMVNPLSIDTVLEDPTGGWSQVAVAGVQPAFSWLAPLTGWYEVTITCSITAAALWCAGAVEVSGGAPIYGELAQTDGSSEGGCTASFIVPCYGQVDYVQAGPYTDTNVNTDVSAPGRYPGIEIAYVSTG